MRWFLGNPVTPGYYDLADSGGKICLEKSPCVGYERPRWREMGPDCEGPVAHDKLAPGPAAPEAIEINPSAEPIPTPAEEPATPPATGTDPAPILPDTLPGLRPAQPDNGDPPPLLPRPALPDPFPEQGGGPAPRPTTPQTPPPNLNPDPFPAPVNPNPLPESTDPGLFPSPEGTGPDAAPPSGGAVPDLFPKNETPGPNERNLVKFGQLLPLAEQASATIQVEASDYLSTETQSAPASAPETYEDPVVWRAQAKEVSDAE